MSTCDATQLVYLPIIYSYAYCMYESYLVAQNESDLCRGRRSLLVAVASRSRRRDDTHGQLERRRWRVDLVALDRILGAVHVLGGRDDEAGTRLRRLGQLDGGGRDREERRVVVDVQYLDAHLLTTSFVHGW